MGSFYLALVEASHQLLHEPTKHQSHTNNHQSHINNHQSPATNHQPLTNQTTFTNHNPTTEPHNYHIHSLNPNNLAMQPNPLKKPQGCSFRPFGTILDDLRSSQTFWTIVDHCQLLRTISDHFGYIWNN